MITGSKLILDKNCPMCQLYAKGFIKTGRIEPDTVAYYHNVEEDIFSLIDAERAKSEVAFVDPKTGNVEYGVDVILKLIAGENRFFKWLFFTRVFHFLALKFYRFISFNRHVIASGNSHFHERQCIPPLHKGYRWAYLIIAALFTGFMVNLFAVELDQAMGVEHSVWREYLICFGQIGWQFIALTVIAPHKRLDYLGNMSTVSLIGALLLIPLLALNAFFEFSWLQLLISFGLIVFTMFTIHVKRCKRMFLPLFTSVSWILFRAFVLILVLIIYLYQYGI